ncbi:MAG TPA: carboxypeptidase regulatory-like domain-containing protein [Blastocatellia bacterium]
MNRITFRLLMLFAIIVASSVAAFSQGITTASLSGSVVDPTGSVISGATIIVKEETTGAEFRTVSAGNGTFSVPALTAGVYSVTISANGFKQAVIKSIKIDAGIPASVNATLEVGATTDTVVVQGGAEVMQTQSASISTTITGRQITDLPFTSRNVTDLLLYLPGTTTPGRPRASSFNGLPQGAINMTLDGVSIQDNGVRNTDGFYTNIYPRVDAVEEVTLSTATPGAESAGEGAIQIKLVTRHGTNEYHGSLYEYHRNKALDANYWFNNRNFRPGPNDDPATFKADRDLMILNQFGGSFGGPIKIPKLFDGHDKAFFFVNYEQFRLATSQAQTRTILSPLAQQGIFQYNTTGGVQKVNLLTLGGVSTLDPTIGKLLSDIRSAATSSGGIQASNDPNLQTYSFSPAEGGEIRIFPTVRLDFELSSKHHLEETWNIQSHHTLVDFLNNGSPAFPGFPNIGSQKSSRFTNSLGLRSTLSPTLVNEARFGLTGGTVVFNGENSLEAFTGPVANQAGYSLAISAAGISNATVNTGSTRRNSPTWNFNDTLNWSRGAHTFNFGGSFFQGNFFSTGTTFVPTINFGVNINDPASALFVASKFPGAASADITRAQNLYATLVGSIISINANAGLDEETGKYTYLAQNTVRARNREMGFFVQDVWRMRPNLTVNGGLRWEVQFPVTSLNNNLTNPTLDGLYGVSGPGNVFNPVVPNPQPSATQFFQFKEGSTAYHTDWNNVAPSLGFAWTPSWKDGFLKRVFGDGGQTVFRGGFSLAFNRDGIGTLIGTISANPGGSISVNRDTNTGNLGTLPVFLSQRDRLGPPAFPDTPIYPLTGAITNAATTYDPYLQTPYIMSWTFGVQREITKDMALEVRYVGNRALKFRQTFNLNEVNITENGFLNEFKLAQSNLMANEAAGRRACPVALKNGSCPQDLAPTFQYFGPNSGTSPLPITLAYFSGPGTTAKPIDPKSAASYTSTNFTNTTFVNTLALNNANPVSFATNLYNTAAFRTNAANALLAPNLFLANPGLQGGASFLGNGGRSTYDSAVVELRRRLSKGLLVQGSYTFARGGNLTTPSLRADYYNSANPLVITHAFKADWVYDLPFGHGRALLSKFNGPIGKALEGWAFQGTARIQSGSPFNIVQNTTSPNLSGVRVVGMTLKELQDSVKVRFDDAKGIAYYLPQDIVDNTIKAFNVSSTSATGYSTRGAPTGRYIAPANSASCTELYAGQCGFPTFFLYGPMFTRFDLNLTKKTKITERVNIEFRADFLNAFNYVNFSVVSPNNAASTIGGLNSDNFGQITQGYRDVSTTNDPGGRMIQFALRLNF